MILFILVRVSYTTHICTDVSLWCIFLVRCLRNRLKNFSDELLKYKWKQNEVYVAIRCYCGIDSQRKTLLYHHIDYIT